MTEITPVVASATAKTVSGDAYGFDISNIKVTFTPSVC